MQQELEGLGNLMKRSDEMKAARKNVCKAQRDTTNVDGPESIRKVDPICSIDYVIASI
jgi:hypothetical protein